MSSTQLFLLGDFAGEVLPTIENLVRLAPGSVNLSVFLQKSTTRLRAAANLAPAGYRRRFPSFASIPELARNLEDHSFKEPAIVAALLCAAQLGDAVVHLEHFPQALEEPSVILGTCTGLLAAAAISCSRNVNDLLAMADQVVELAFWVGLEASMRSDLHSSTAGSWATLVPIANTPELTNILEAVNLETEINQRVYVSAQGPSSVTINCPPSRTTKLFMETPILKGVRAIPLPIFAAFHASHFDAIPTSRVVGRLDGQVLGRPIQHQMVSPSSGQTYSAATFADAVAEATRDIFQEPIMFDAYAAGVSRLLHTRSQVFCFGPVNSVKAIQRALVGAGNELTIGEVATSNLPSNSGAVAIIGMASRLPGSETLEEFWKVLEEGRDLHEKIRPDRFDIETHCDPTGKRKNTSLTPYGVFIDRPGYFDTRMFNMSPREAAQTDPQQRMLLLTTYEALEMAGYSPNRTPSTDKRRIGSFIGQTSDDWREVNASQNVDTYFITGGIRAFGPGRLNYHFGWEGPSYSVDTACSSSAASIQLACSALLAGECDTAVGGGANLLTASDLFAGLSRGSFLSKTGGCKTFDHDADGYVRADAVGVVVLKRLDDAIRDRDNVLAVVRSAVTNHSAEAVSITHPHAETQERLFRTALDKAGIHPHGIDYAELHGTGTQAGDATESRSVTNVLARGRTSDNRLFVGTVKPNLGHGEAASGVTSLIKAVMMLRKNTIPPHVGIKGRINQKLPPLASLNTRISFGNTPFLPRKNGDGKRRILINNFDAAGGNTSMVIEDPPVLCIDGEDPRPHHVVTISGKTPKALLENSRKLLDFLRGTNDIRLEDVAYTTTARRMHHNLRSAHVSSSIEGLSRSLEKAIDEEKWGKPLPTQPPVVFLFTGQGSQYSGMASALLNSNVMFRGRLEKYDKICVSHGFASFLPLLNGAVDLAQATPVQVQLSLVSIELAIAEFWKDLGVVPKAVLGHSLGEYPALCVAGVIPVSDCLYLVGKRASLIMDKCVPGTHSMLALQISEENAASLIAETEACEIACVNGPASTVVSGPSSEIAQFREQTLSQGIKSTFLGIQYAFHSAQMDNILEDFSAVGRRVHFSPPSIPVASTVTGKVIDKSESIGLEYLKLQTRGRVQFFSALQNLKALFSERRAVWIETGPSPTCLGLVRGALGDEELLLPSLKKSESDWKILSGAVARAYIAGIDIDWPEFHRPYESALRLIELPTYAFDLKNYWIQYEGDWAVRKGDPTPAPPSEAKVLPPSSSTTSLHRIEAEVRDESGVTVIFAADASEPKLNKALRGHLVNGAGLCPSSVYADMAFTAAKYIQSLSGITLDLCMDVREMEVHKPLLISSGATRQVICVTATKKSSSDLVDVSFSSQDGGQRQDHAHCVVSFGEGKTWQKEWSRMGYLVKSRIDHLTSASANGQAHRLLRPMVYKLFAALVDYDAGYQGIEEVHMDSGLFEAAAKVKFNTSDRDGTFTYSPYWIDSLAHLSGFILNGADNTPADAVFISHGWGSMKIVGDLSADKRYQSYVRMRETQARGVMAGDVYFFEGDDVVAVCQDLKFQKIKRHILNLIMPSDAPGHSVATKKPPKSAPRPAAQRQRKSVPTKAQIQAPVDVLNGSAAKRPLAFSEILEIVASEIGVDLSDLAGDAVFADLGVDSLLSLSISAKLSQHLSQDIPATIFHECLTVKDLRQYFAGSSGGEVDSSSSSDASDDEPQIFTGNASFIATPLSMGSPTPASPPNSLADIFKKIIATEAGLEEDEIGEETPLADLGVDSLLSLAILAAVKEQTGRILPSSFLLDNPNFSAICLALDGGSPQSPLAEELTSALEKAKTLTAVPKAEAVLLQGSTQSNGPALFLLPDGSGSASSYVNLPKLGVTGAIYGLNSPFLAAPKAFTVPLKEVAAMYVTEIRRIQPHGPYHLAGWSIGGTYAFEVASQLINLHEEPIGSLVFIDAPCPKYLPPLPTETIELLEKIGAFDGLKDRKTKMRDGVKEHFAGSVNALKQYRPAILDAVGIESVTVLWARHGVWETVGEGTRTKFGGQDKTGNAARDWIMDPRKSFDANGWDELLPGAHIKCEVVTGDHFSIMRKPGIAELGRRLGEAETYRHVDYFNPI
ncbi:hypothetical protein OQA88_10823 [Cercophora sp. LCS_1]